MRPIVIEAPDGTTILHARPDFDGSAQSNLYWVRTNGGMTSRPVPLAEVLCMAQRCAPENTALG